MTPLGELCRWPLVVAPMGGGPSTPALVGAAADAGAIGFVAGGYKTADALREEIGVVRARGRAYGVNVFVPGGPTTDAGALARYVAELAPEAAALGVELGSPQWDDDGWDAKVRVLVDEAPPVVSFTFGCPPPDLVAELRGRGSLVIVTVTSADEAATAVAAGADLLCAQGAEAGAHRGSFDDAPGARPQPVRSLLAAVRARTGLPVVAAGGIARPDDVRAVLDAGAVAVQVGTAFLRCPESGAHPEHKAALADPAFTATAFTRAFSGRLARGLVNRFMTDHPTAPCAYPEVNNATRPLRAAAARAGDRHRMSLWAGTGFRSTTDRPAAEIVQHLVEAVRHRGGTRS